MKLNKWYIGVYFEYVIFNQLFAWWEIICTNILYNYVGVELFEISNVTLIIEFRRNTKF